MAPAGSPGAVAQAPARVTAPHLSAADAGRLDGEIATLWFLVADLDAAMASPQRARFDTAENWRRYAALQAELRRLETQRYGAPVILKEVRGRLEFKDYAVTETPAAISASAPGLDLAAVALLMLIGAALGLLISASSLAAILTEKAATVRVEADAAPAPRKEPAPAAIYHPAESADGFEAWALACVSKLDGKSIRPAEAHASYLAFCARNDYQAPLAIQEFGRRFRGWLIGHLRDRRAPQQRNGVRWRDAGTAWPCTRRAHDERERCLMLFAWLKPRQQPQHGEAQAFVQALAIDAALPFAVLAAAGRNGLDVATFSPRSGDMRDWIAKRASRRLFVLTAQASAPLAGRAISETDLSQTRIVAVGVPAAQGRALDAFRPAPSIIAETPRGLACAWRLRNPTAPAKARELAAQIAAHLGGSPLEHLFPLPGTGNARLLRHVKGPDAWALVTAFDAALGNGPATETAASESLFAPADSFEIEATDWLWPNVVACGDLTLLGGAPGMGKSQVAIYAAATVSRGGTWPDGSRGATRLCDPLRDRRPARPSPAPTA